MDYLRYASNEMFSSTQLIRQSKQIFDKLNTKDIEKAVILRDGKPTFMMLDFETYENIMSEYIMLKQNFETGTQKEIRTTVQTNIDKVSQIVEDDELKDIPESENIIEDITPDEKSVIKSKEEEDLKKALEQLEALNLDDSLKEEAKEKILKSTPEIVQSPKSEETEEIDMPLSINLDEIEQEENPNTKGEIKEFWN
jgi:LPS O-antigen subunit length determinant protein (WzzB/FepE family)